jgi:hypothetical protein
LFAFSNCKYGRYLTPRQDVASSHRAANAVIDVDVQDAARLRAMRWSTSCHVSKPQRLASGLLGLLWALVAGLPQTDPGAAAVLVDKLDARGLDPSLGTSFGSNVNLRSVFTSLWTALVEVHIRVA